MRHSLRVSSRQKRTAFDDHGRPCRVRGAEPVEIFTRGPYKRRNFVRNVIGVYDTRAAFKNLNVSVFRVPYGHVRERKTTTTTTIVTLMTTRARGERRKIKNGYVFAAILYVVVTWGAAANSYSLCRRV